ncbi:MAG: PRK06851 family protein [Halanaerobiales bacterium]
MSSSGKVKNYFPGGNTCRGFYSFYEYLPYNAERIFIIKGGPGTGKSTFMKNIAEEFLNEGYPIEYHWCSSDNDSLDGVVIPDLKVALLDGTAPHLVDPQNPGAVDEIVNLGRYWNRSILSKHKQQIVTLNKTIWKYFDKAYGYLEEAKLVHDRWEEYYLEGMDFQKANLKVEKLKKKIFAKHKLANKLGKHRHLFGSAFTPKGAVDYFSNITADCEKRYVIKGKPGTGKSTLAKKIAQSALERGLNVNYFHCSFDPDSIDMIVIPELKLSLVDGTPPHIVNPNRTGDEVVDMLDCIDQQHLRQKQEQIQETKLKYQDLMKNALKELQQAKKLHDQLEEYYIEAMSFDQIDHRREEIKQEIKKRI